MHGNSDFAYDENLRKKEIHLKKYIQKCASTFLYANFLDFNIFSLWSGCSCLLTFRFIHSDGLVKGLDGKYLCVFIKLPTYIRLQNKTKKNIFLFVLKSILPVSFFSYSDKKTNVLPSKTAKKQDSFFKCKK